MIRKTKDGTWEFDTIEEALRFEALSKGTAAAPKTAEPEHQKPTESTENKHNVPTALWDGLRKEVHRIALNLVIEAGTNGMMVTDLVPRLDYNPKGVGGLLNAIRSAATRVGLDPDTVIRSERVMVRGAQQSRLLSSLSGR